MTWSKSLPLILLLALAVVVWLPLPVPYNMDFSMLYAADVGLWHGVGLYDHAGQTDLLAELRNLPAETLNLPFFVYPPWLAWGTAFLGLLPPAAAARLWLFLSLGMVLGAGWLLTEGGPPRERFLLSLLALFWLPTLGLLVVGQYVPPVLLGLALFWHGWRGERPALAALGLVLLTVKPHVGLLPFLAGLFLLWRAQKRLALGWVGGLLAGLALVSFLVQPDWPLAYWGALTSFRGQETFGLCGQCAGAGVLLARLLIGLPRMDVAVRLVAGLTGVTVLWLAWAQAWRWRPARLLETAVLLGLLLNPYLMNYDYLLLLFPLWLRRPSARGGILILLLPWLALIGGRLAVNFVLAGMTLALLVWSSRHEEA